MDDDTVLCARCREPMPPGLEACPACGHPVTSVPGPAGTRTVARAAPARAEAPSPPAAIEERLARLERWREIGEGLGLEVPSPPAWVVARARRDPAGWERFLEELEAEARPAVAARLAAWEKDTLSRLTRLEAYSIDGRLEREQVEDGLAAARSGDAGRALAVVQQVDRVLLLKERHLTLARQELDRLTELLQDLAALGLPVPYSPREIAEELELELRGGRLAPLKAQLRALRLEVIRTLATAFPERLARTAAGLEAARARGAPVGPAVEELVRCARAYAEGRPDEAIRRLRRLAEGSPSTAPSGPARREGPATGASRTA